MTELQPHQQRVVAEKEELDDKLTKPRAFTETELFAGLDAAEQVRLNTQRMAMSMYSEILGQRIAAF